MPVQAQYDLLLPMDNSQSDHLKAYGTVYWALQRGESVDWLLNYRGGSFLVANISGLDQELSLRGVSHERVAGSSVAQLISEVESNRANTALVRLETPPRIAVYAP